MTTVPYGTRVSAHALLRELAERHPVPLVAAIQPTRRCNLSCAHCFQVGREVEELGTAQWSGVLRRLADAGVLFLTITGGEPTLRGDLLDLVRIARDLAFAVKVKTNGIRLDSAACAAFSATPVMEVQLSFYSVDPAAHDRVTGLQGSHAATLLAARRLRDGGTRVVLACPIMADTFDGHDRLIGFAAAEQMDYSFDPGIAVREDGCEGPAALRLSDSQLKRLLSDPRVVGREGRAAVTADGLDRPVCRVGKAAVSVAPNGDVWPCERLDEPLGNLLRAPLEEIWCGNPLLDRYSSIRWRDLPDCRSCDLIRHCVRCHADALKEDGDLYGPCRTSCRTARIRAEIASRTRPAPAVGANGGDVLAGTGRSGIFPGVAGGPAQTGMADQDRSAGS